MDETPELRPFQRLVCASAGKGAERTARIFALDNACARIAQTVTEPFMAQIRLAWWRDGLMTEALSAQHDAPDILALRSIDDFSRARLGLVAMIDGWEELIVSAGVSVSEMLSAYAEGRGAGLFAALVPEYADHSAVAGEAWALWDLAGHLSDPDLAKEAIHLANDFADSANIARLPRMLKIMAGPALADIRRTKGAPRQLTPGLYARMMRYQIFGR